MLIEEAVLPGTPDFVVESYKRLEEMAKTRDFGLIEEDVIILDTETTGLSLRDNELIEISAARLRGREIVDTFDTFVHPSSLIPAEITRLTSITNADVADAPSAEEAVASLAEFIGGCPVIAHNATFDRSFIEAVKGGVNVSEIWIDSLALSRIALPRLSSHKLAFIAEVFGCDAVSHRANDDVAALAGVWRILLCALAELPQGLALLLANMHPDVPWSYRPIFSYLAQTESEMSFSLYHARTRVIEADGLEPRKDADDLPNVQMPTETQIRDAFMPGGIVEAMYASYEPRDEQIEMALAVRDAVERRNHCVIEAGTGVGKSMAYLVPLALAAKKNNITVGVATKSNNLADQLMYQELPRLSEQIPGGLSFFALKGYDHYPCLRKLERLSKSNVQIRTSKDPADTLTAIAVIYAYAVQSAEGDLDALGIRWKSVNRSDLTSTSRECQRHLCPFYPDRCLVHGARRRAACADVVVTNHSLLFRNVAAEGKILPPIRHWVVDEAHSVENEARKQWSRRVSADESELLFSRLGTVDSGALARLEHELSKKEGASLYVRLTSKAIAAAGRAGGAMAEVFDGVREVGKLSRERYENINLWISDDVRASDTWSAFADVCGDALHELDEADRSLAALVEAAQGEPSPALAEVSDLSRTLHECKDNLRLIVEGTDSAYVYSLQFNKRKAAGNESLTAEMLDIGQAFADLWFPETESVIFTSATMAVDKSFAHFNKAVGLNRVDKDELKTLHLDSSYNFDRNMAVVVASDMHDPDLRNYDAYLDDLEKLLTDVHVAMGGSVLTLFTNRKDMEEMYERIHPVLDRKGLEIAYQAKGSSSKRLRDHFVAEPASSLFALRAFWEGFDAAGDTLRCVVIPKLPFVPPTDPIAREREQREERAWLNHTLPEAVLTVKQAAGRLIRSSSDRGVLVLADSRLLHKGYGRKFLNSLPTASYQKIEINHVGEYLKLWQKAHRA